jgi:hypothetical protein
VDAPSALVLDAFRRSVLPFFISAMNLLTANSVLGAFSERRLTNIFFLLSVKCNPYSNKQAKFWTV